MVNKAEEVIATVAKMNSRMDSLDKGIKQEITSLREIIVEFRTKIIQTAQASSGFYLTCSVVAFSIFMVMTYFLQYRTTKNAILQIKEEERSER